MAGAEQHSGTNYQPQAQSGQTRRKKSTSTPGQTRLHQAKPGQTRLHQAKPDYTRPHQAKPDHTRPNQTTPGQTTTCLFIFITCRRQERGPQDYHIVMTTTSSCDLIICSALQIYLIKSTQGLLHKTSCSCPQDQASLQVQLVPPPC